MAFYLNLNESTAFDTLPTVDCDKLINMDEVNACFEESSMEAAARICYENTVNWNNIQQAVTIDELIHLESTGVEMLYEGAKIDTFIEKAKAFFKSIWNKIQEMFKKAAMQFNAWFQKDAEFIKKYEKTIRANMRNKDYGDKEISVYNYIFYNSAASAFSTIADPKVSTEITASGAPDAARKDIAEKYSKEKITKKLNEVRGTISGKGGEIEAGEFNKIVKVSLQGDDNKTDVKLASMAEKAMSFLRDSKNFKTQINEGLKQSKKSINDAIRACEELQKQFKKQLSGEDNDENALAGIKHTEATKIIEVLKGSRSIVITYTGIVLDCLKACSRQSKSICVKLVGTKNQTDKESVNASYVSQTSTGSVLESVQLI